MAVRLVELHRVLKQTGSLYLHCDPTASHYLKLLLDAVFDARNFRNEVIWERATAKNDPKRYGRTHDVLLFYSRSAVFTWNPIFQPLGRDFGDLPPQLSKNLHVRRTRDRTPLPSERPHREQAGRRHRLRMEGHSTGVGNGPESRRYSPIVLMTCGAQYRRP
ncbi:MAG: hypothetical protein C0498_05570 [Anaerolinea sp.]|nr:hypothetical protein [Anaerolinea sp.]